MTKKFKTREAWLNEFTRRARPVFKAKGYTIPDNVRVSVGFTSKGAKTNRIGECWSSKSSEDGAFEIFITPAIGDASRIADIHTHELIHATVGLEAGHKKPFVDCMKAVGLIGKPTATIAGPEWHAWADKILESLGPLPHAALKAGGNGVKKQSTRMIKCQCQDCGFVMRTSSQWIENACGDLRCPDPICGGSMDIG
ncbi:transcription elongation protein [Pseudanabaena phage Pan1]|nr:transcription elongation protein [Pseudanabaena phage Pan1]